MDLPSSKLEVRPRQQIIDRCREVIHRARRRFLKKNLRACPLNCQFAIQRGNDIDGCGQCLSYNAEKCMRSEEFVPIYNKEELAEQFREELYDQQILFRKYPAIGVLLWVLGVVTTVEAEVQIDVPKMENLEKHSG